MSTMLINTREVLELLEESGIKKEQARAITKAMETIDVSSLTTKADLAELEAKLYRVFIIQTFGLAGFMFALIKLV